MLIEWEVKRRMITLGGGVKGANNLPGFVPQKSLGRKIRWSMLNGCVWLKEVAQVPLDARVGFLSAPSSLSVASADGFHKTID